MANCVTTKQGKASGKMDLSDKKYQVYPVTVTWHDGSHDLYQFACLKIRDEWLEKQRGLYKRVIFSDLNPCK